MILGIGIQIYCYGQNKINNYTDSSDFVPRTTHTKVSHFGSHTGQLAQVINRVRYVPVILVFQNTSRTFDVLNFSLEVQKKKENQQTFICIENETFSPSKIQRDK